MLILAQIPIVASTGGLVDTVKEGYTGFHIGAFNVDVSKEAIALVCLSLYFGRYRNNETLNGIFSSAKQLIQQM